MIKFNDTIYALSTPTGKSALAVIRVSGKKSKKILQKLCSIKKIKPNSVKLTYFNLNKNIIDQVLVTYFEKPKSFTGEEMLEISCHGSTTIILKISEALEQQGLRLAEPGEFTRRALMNDKIDLVQAESLSDLINAETEKQRSLAISNLSRGLSNFVEEIINNLKNILANTEALIDFVDEDLPKNITNKIEEQKKNIIKKIEKELNNSEISKPIREGYTVSIVGKPNTGKSSFINFISKKNISIVTNIPGTTTDTVTSALDINGYKFTFIDTAGLRKFKNKIEELGIKKTKEIMLKSDLNLVFLKKNEKENYTFVKNKIFVRSKLDKRPKEEQDNSILHISSLTGDGIIKLMKKIEKKLIKTKKNEPMFSRERHKNIMKKVLNELKSIKKGDTLDVKAFKYREALQISLEINERFDIENILDIIFSDFCIG